MENVDTEERQMGHTLTRIIGRPGRIGGLEQVFRHMAAKGGV